MIDELQEIERVYGRQLSARARFTYAVEALDNPYELDPRDLADKAGISESMAYEYLKEDRAAREVLQ